MIDYTKVLSENVQKLEPSGIRRFFDILDEMDDAISLGVGEPDFVTPWHIRDAGIVSLERGFTRYTSNSGMLTLRKEIAAYQERRFGLAYDAVKEILVTVGGSEAIDLTIRALVSPGDEVIIPVPSFVCYEPITKLCGGKPVLVETKVADNFRLTAADLEKAITDRTKLLILPFPNNPTGAVMERHDLEAVADVLRGTDIMVLSDEIYAELTYTGTHVSIAGLPGMRERSVVVGGFSKSHAMTGWRMGYVMAPPPITTQLTKIHQYALMSAPTTSQYAAIEAMRNGDGDTAEMRTDYNRRRKLLLAGLRKLGLDCFEPGGAFYVFPSISATGLTSDAFCERFLLEKKVAVIPGSAFGPGGEGFVRMCYASSTENLTEALSRLEDFLKSFDR